MNIILSWMGRQSGTTDVLLSFDGRNVTDRKAMAKAFEGFRNPCDLWVLYEPSKRVGRRVAWASDTRETGFLSLPLPRTSISTKDRTTVAKAWAPSTHWSFYQGVPQVAWGSLPQVKAEDKKLILGVEEVAEPPAKLWDSEGGFPLYWSERKPVEFWEDILLCLDASVVVDLSPGSGSVGRAALRLGLQYVACCRTDEHTAFLGHVFDREACEQIVKSQSPLFEQDLSQLVSTHFAEILEGLKRSREAEDKEAEPESESSQALALM